MNEDVVTYLADIIEAAEKIERYTDGLSLDEFRADEKTVDAVLRNFEVIGEAAKNVPDDFQQEYPNVPWTEMAGMRDKLIHGYASVDLEIVWTTVVENIPSLREQVETVRNDVVDGEN